MGNTPPSAADAPLASQTHQPVTLPPECLGKAPPQVLANATKLRLEQLPGSDDLWVFDFATGERLYRLDEKISTDWTDRMLVDAHGEPVVRIQKELAYFSNYFLKAPSDESDASAYSNNKKPHVKLTSGRYHDKIEMELKLVDAASGEKVTVFAKDKWKLSSCTLALWLARGSSKHSRELIGSITRTPDAGYNVEIAAGIDLAITALLTIMLREIVNTHDTFSQMNCITFLG